MTDNDLDAAHSWFQTHHSSTKSAPEHCCVSWVSLAPPDVPDPYKMARFTTVLLLAVIASVAIHGEQYCVAIYLQRSGNAYT